MTDPAQPQPFSPATPQPAVDPRKAPRSLGRRLRGVVFPGRRAPFPEQPAVGVDAHPLAAPGAPTAADRTPRHAIDALDTADVRDEPDPMSGPGAAPAPAAPPTFVALLSATGFLLDEPPSSASDPVGWLAVDAVGRQLWDAPWWSWSPDVQDRLRNAVRRAGAGEVVSYGDTVRARGNLLVTVGLTLSPVVSPTGITGVRCSVLDPDHIEVTDRRGAPRHLSSADAAIGAVTG